MSKLLKKLLRAMMLPNMASVPVASMEGAAPFDDGVGITNHRNRMIGWIKIEATDPALRKEHFRQVLEILNTIINDPENAVQPDWSFLNTTAPAAASTFVTSPTRASATSSQSTAAGA